jgi:hypothetical protein
MTETEGHEPAAEVLGPETDENPSSESTRGHRGLLAGWRRGKLDESSELDSPTPERERQDEAHRLEHALSDLGTAARNLVELQRGHEQMERRLVEVERAATQRGEALAQLREHLHAREAEIERLREEAGRARLHAEPAQEEVEPIAGHLLFIPDGSGYRLEERPGPPPAPGERVVLEAGHGSLQFVVTKLGTSPLPADRRPCSYLLPAPAPATG